MEIKTIKKYIELREFLFNNGFKCVDIDLNGNEIFQINKVKFAIVEID